MKKMFILLALLVPALLFSQVGMFGTDYARKDTTWLVSAATADTAYSLTQVYSQDGLYFKGQAALYLAAYSPDGTIDDTLRVYGQLYGGQSDRGDNLYTTWTLLDSVVDATESAAYGSGAMTFRMINLRTAFGDQWQANNGVRCMLVYTATADTVVALLRFKEILIK